MTATIQIVGHVGKSPELRKFDESGTQKATFAVAVNEYRGKEKEQQTTWYYIETWNGGCDRVMEYITKGREVVITGTLVLNTFSVVSDGKERIRIVPVIKMNNFHLCGKRPQTDEESSDSP
ncbi:MAG: single-stranded DNA-binding protein [Candidatus Obscuribacterales bacterium]|nr:single-stranded DNA-binding protein [Candidatus Obscuribacterales bacterium]